MPGPGRDLSRAFLHCQGLDVTALEPGLGGFGVSAALAQAVQKCPEFAALHRLDLPAEGLSPVVHGSFDFIYSVNVLEHIPRLEDALSAMGRVLAEDGEMLHTCPNYLVPYEPHFGVPLIPLFPRWTAPFVRRNGLDELWNSLNFVTARQIRSICRKSDMEVSFRPEILYQAFLRLEQDPEFLKRQSNGLVVGAFRLLKATGLLRALRFLPPGLATPMVFTIKRRAKGLEN
jgi:SAM-dependent methyltransferase